jgi:hypothetical protein
MLVRGEIRFIGTIEEIYSSTESRTLEEAYLKLLAR